MSAIIPCIFGTTKGFEIVEMAPLPFKMKDMLVAITQGEVELSLEDTCIKMLRIKVGSEVYTWIGLYRKAYEMGFSREGGYYGAGVWLSDTTVNARQVLEVLEDLAQQIRRLAMEDRKFQRPLSSIEQQLVPSQALSALLRNNAPYASGGISANAKNCAFISQPQSTREILDWAQSDALAHNFQSVIIAPASTFPKAGASGSIKQYADVTTLERALERDYTARLSKLDAQNKDLHARNKSLESEAQVRSSEIQVLRQKYSQLELAASRSKLLSKPDARYSASDDDSFLSRDNAIPLICWAALAILSVFGNVIVGLLYAGAEAQVATVRQERNNASSERDTMKTQLSAKETELELAYGQLALAKEQLKSLRAQEEEDAGAGQAPDNSATESGSSSNQGVSNSSVGQNGDPNAKLTEATVPNYSRASGDKFYFNVNVLPEPQNDDVGTLSNNITKQVELAILAKLIAGRADVQELTEDVDDKRLTLSAATEVPVTIKELLSNNYIRTEKNDIGNPTGRYVITNTGKKYYDQISEQIPFQ